MSQRIPPTTPEAIRDSQLAEVGRKLLAVDQTLVACIARRLILTRRVAEIKRAVEENPAIVRRDVERTRIHDMGLLAAELGVEPMLAQSIEFQIIGESVKVQAEALRQPAEGVPDRVRLRQNLLELTAAVAPSYADEAKNHGGSCPASRSLRAFESDLIAAEIGRIDGHRHLIADIGCADGSELLRHIDSFAAGVGYDISPAMIDVARGKLKRNHRCALACADVEEGIPLGDGEACFVFLNNGTGSDFFDLPRVLAEVARTLRHKGRFFASFHNADALASAHGWLPWVSALRAVPSRERGTLMVRSATGKVFEIPGRAYSLEEVTRATPPSLRITSSWTHSHFLSMLPPSVFTTNPPLRAAVEAIDAQLATGAVDGGAYLMVSGIKD